MDMECLVMWVLIFAAFSTTRTAGETLAPSPEIPITTTPVVTTTTTTTPPTPSTTTTPVTQTVPETTTTTSTTTPATTTTEVQTSATATTASLSPSPTPAWLTTVMTTTTAAANQTMAATLPDVGTAGDVVTQPPPPWMSSWEFHCDRPNSQCDSMYGMCDPNTGQCNCFNQAFGVRCQGPNGALQNAGVCQISNPCKRGSCYDDGVGAKCACPDGYYGDRCQHEMVHVECTQDKMVINLFPYGFSEVLWDYIPPPTVGTCPLERMAVFMSKASSYKNRGWQGFAREILHRADPCAGDAVSFVNNPASTLYSREVYVYHDSGRHYTDIKLKVSCEVLSVPATQSPTGLPPPQVSVQFLDRVPGGRRLHGPIKLGTPVVVQFSVNPVNNANIDDLRVETCTITNGMGSQKIIVVDHGCVVPPVGKLVQRGQPGTQFLSLVMHSFPNSPFLDFQCRVRLCDSVKHDACRAARFCLSRRKRAARRSHPEAKITDVGFQFTM